MRLVGGVLVCCALLAFLFRQLQPTMNSTASMRAKVRKLLPTVEQLASRHKGQSGKVGVVGGSYEYTGAPYFAAMAALRVGADLSHVFCLKDAAGAIKSYSGDLIVHPALSSEKGSAKASVEAVQKWFPALQALVVGPGLGRDPEVLEAARGIIRAAMSEEHNLWVVVDGDGLWR